MPKEVHEHWAVDPDDPENGEKHKLTGYTIITRESPWDEDTRARALALTEHEDSLCKCGCGRPAIETLRKDVIYDVRGVRCAAGRAIDHQRRLDREAHKDDPTWDDGLHYYAEPAGHAEVAPDPD